MAIKDFFDGTERRQFVRVAHPLNARFRFEDSSWHDCSVSNISAGGLCLSVDNADSSVKSSIEANPQSVYIEVLFPDDVRVPTKCQVVRISPVSSKLMDLFRCRAYSIGVEFREIAPADRKMISDFIIHKYLGKYTSPNKKS